MGAERRRWQRFPVPAKILVTPKTKPAFEARVQDLSEGGAFILTDVDLPNREILFVTFFPGGGERELSLSGELARVIPAGPSWERGIGVEFLASTAVETRAAIRKWVQELASGMARDGGSNTIDMHGASPAAAPVTAPAVAPVTAPAAAPAATRAAAPPRSPSSSAGRPPPPRTPSTSESKSAAPRPPSQKPAVAQDVAQGGGATPRILVVQDNRELSELLINILSKAGCETRAAHDSKAALEAIKSASFDVIIIDWLPADLPGDKMIQVLRSVAAHVPIVVVSALSQNPAFVARAVDLGATTFLKKPFQMKDLAAALTQVLS